MTFVFTYLRQCPMLQKRKSTSRTKLDLQWRSLLDSLSLTITALLEEINVENSETHVKLLVVLIVRVRERDDNQREHRCNHNKDDKRSGTNYIWRVSWT